MRLPIDPGLISIGRQIAPRGTRGVLRARRGVLKIADAIDALRGKARVVEQQARTAERQSGQDALGIARAYSSGPYSTQILRMLGHPYAAAHPKPPAKPSIINVQTGAFRARWRLVVEKDRVRVVNDSPLSVFFARGTRYMIRRPIARAVAAAIGARRKQRLKQAIDTALDS